jgi:hypothetical protein
MKMSQLSLEGKNTLDALDNNIGTHTREMNRLVEILEAVVKIPITQNGDFNEDFITNINKALTDLSEQYLWMIDERKETMFDLVEDTDDESEENA